MTASAIYEGWVTHRRLGRSPHGFRYRVFMPLFDLDELPELLDPIPLWSARRPAPARFHREDYLGGDPPTRRERSRSGGEARRAPADGTRAAARQPPVSGGGVQPGVVLFAYGEGGSSVEAVIAEVTSTPWGERTAYVLDGKSAGGGPIVGSFQKDMHATSSRWISATRSP